MNSDSPPLSAPRVAWIDIARVFTMLCTMLTHAPVMFALKQRMWFTGSGRMCLLFVVAGYFMAKPKKGQSVVFPQAGRAVRMFFAYVILIALYVAVLGWTPFWTWQVLDPLIEGSWDQKADVLCHLFGIGDQPPGPFWFLRDLIILTICCGGLVYLKKKGWLLIICLALVCFGKELACNHFKIMSYQVIHPREIAFFSLGVCLSSVSIQSISEYLMKCRWVILISTPVIFIYEWMTLDHPSPVGIAFYMLSTCVIALYVEKGLPRFGKWMASLGETVFLVYVLHMLIISFIWYAVRLWYKDASATLPEYYWFLLVPLLYLLIHYFGMAIKRMNPGLFALIAIRPPVAKATGKHK